MSPVATKLTLDEDEPTRVILIPSFVKTGLVVLVCLETLECKTVGFEIPSWVGERNGLKEDVEME